MKKNIITFIASFFIVLNSTAQSWTADNGNGTFTNPLFYDEFSDPDMIRVGNDFYLTGTTMHSIPGLPVLHSKDLVNWSFISYAANRFNMGPEFCLENGRDIYGQGYWAPCIRYNKGTFYIFSNINRHGLYIFTAQNPAGPWKHKRLGDNLHDLSVLFDDDGKIYAVYDYDEVKIIEIKPDFSGYVEGSRRVIIPAGCAMGEGHHFYKINGKYYIISANYAPVGRMQCARADRPEGPYETTVISANETLGMKCAYSVQPIGQRSPVPGKGTQFKIFKPNENGVGAAALHQGGIVDLPNGDWWGFSMMDFRAVGRTTCLSPVTWQDGWPYFGLSGNLGRSPCTWVKPNIGFNVKPTAPYQRSDDFNGKALQAVWQWNHDPVDSKWSLNRKKGVLRLQTLPAENLLWARNTLTQRGIGPESYATVTLDAGNLKAGDVAGLALFNIPYAWVGVARTDKGSVLRWYNQISNQTIDVPLTSDKVYLRATGNFDKSVAHLSYSLDDNIFKTIGDSILLPYQLKTFQGTRYALFAFNTLGKEGGSADFDDFIVNEPMSDRSKDFPVGKVITLTNLGNDKLMWACPLGMLHSIESKFKGNDAAKCQFRVCDRGRGRVVLQTVDGTGFITVVGAGLSADVRVMKQEGEGSLFQWQDMLCHQCMLLSLKTHRYIGLNPGGGEPYSANWAGASPSRKNGTVFVWQEAE
ncbi:MAG: glycoside hydrolase 43 family protein [Bacteroidaceae bacterium]